MGRPPLQTNEMLKRRLIPSRYHFCPLRTVLAHSTDRLICSHEFAEALLKGFWSVDSRTRVDLYQMKGCKYIKVPGSADVGDPFNFTILDDAPSRWLEMAPYGGWSVVLSYMCGLPTSTYPARNANCALGPILFTLMALHGS